MLYSTKTWLGQGPLDWMGWLNIAFHHGRTFSHLTFPPSPFLPFSLPFLPSLTNAFSSSHPDIAAAKGVCAARLPGTAAPLFFFMVVTLPTPVPNIIPLSLFAFLRQARASFPPSFTVPIQQLPSRMPGMGHILNWPKTYIFALPFLFSPEQLRTLNLGPSHLKICLVLTLVMCLFFHSCVPLLLPTILPMFSPCIAMPGSGICHCTFGTFGGVASTLAGSPLYLLWEAGRCVRSLSLSYPLPGGQIVQHCIAVSKPHIPPCLHCQHGWALYLLCLCLGSTLSAAWDRRSLPLGSSAFGGFCAGKGRGNLPRMPLRIVTGDGATPDPASPLLLHAALAASTFASTLPASLLRLCTHCLHLTHTCARTTTCPLFSWHGGRLSCYLCCPLPGYGRLAWKQTGRWTGRKEEATSWFVSRRCCCASPIRPPSAMPAFLYLYLPFLLHYFPTESRLCVACNIVHGLLHFCMCLMSVSPL